MDQLTGLRVLDFCWVGAGAFVTRILSDLGAEVIKVESESHPDNLRISGPHKPGAKALESSGYFAARNTGKKSIALNMGSAEGRALALRLAGECSIVTNNFRPGVMEKWGLGYDAIAALNPSVIYLSMPMQGSSGPNRDFIGFGSTISALCGLVNMAGEADRPPIGTGTHYPDHVPNPGHALVALLAAVYHRIRSGEGQYIELAQIESTVNLSGAQIMAWSATGAVPVRDGNRKIGSVPRGVYACAGTEVWCAIEVASDRDWQGLTTALGWDDWASDASLATLAGREARAAEIDRRLRDATRGFDVGELVQLLQAENVPAAMVATAADVASDPQLVERGYWHRIHHAEMGEVLANVPPFAVLGEARAAPRPQPLLGEHTDEIAGRLLGLDAAECRRLRAEKVFY